MALVKNSTMIKYPHRTFDVRTSGFYGISRLVNLNSLDEITEQCIVNYVQGQVYTELKTLGLVHMAENFSRLKLTLSIRLEQVLDTPTEIPIYIYEQPDTTCHAG